MPGRGRGCPRPRPRPWHSHRSSCATVIGAAPDASNGWGEMLPHAKLLSSRHLHAYCSVVAPCWLGMSESAATAGDTGVRIRYVLPRPGSAPRGRPAQLPDSSTVATMHRPALRYHARRTASTAAIPPMSIAATGRFRRVARCQCPALGRPPGRGQERSRSRGALRGRPGSHRCRHGRDVGVEDAPTPVPRWYAPRRPG